MAHLLINDDHIVIANSQLKYTNASDACCPLRLKRCTDNVAVNLYVPQGTTGAVEINGVCYYPDVEADCPQTVSAIDATHANCAACGTPPPPAQPLNCEEEFESWVLPDLRFTVGITGCAGCFQVNNTPASDDRAVNLSGGVGVVTINMMGGFPGVGAAGSFTWDSGGGFPNACREWVNDGTLHGTVDGVTDDDCSLPQPAPPDDGCNTRQCGFAPQFGYVPVYADPNGGPCDNLFPWDEELGGQLCATAQGTCMLNTGTGLYDVWVTWTVTLTNYGFVRILNGECVDNLTVGVAQAGSITGTPFWLYATGTATTADTRTLACIPGTGAFGEFATVISAMTATVIAL